MSHETLIQALPKAELHIHIEGSLEPELMLRLAQKNKISLPYDTIDQVKQAYQFSNLQSFLDIYYHSASVLIDEEDFFELTWAYIKRAHQDNIKHCELFFDPQTHTSRGIKINTVIQGMKNALTQAQDKLGISAFLIPCILRHLSPNEAMHTLEQLIPYQQDCIALGLDSSELNHPPSQFIDVFDRARSLGFLTVAHAGEEGPADYIWQAIKQLKVARIDHGIRCLEDGILIEYLRNSQIPLTVCPLSNTALKVCNDMKEHPLKKILDHGLCVTVNSDDPAFFGGYLNDNYLAASKALKLTPEDIKQLTINGFEASFLPHKEKQRHINAVKAIETTQ